MEVRRNKVVLTSLLLLYFITLLYWLGPYFLSFLQKVVEYHIYSERRTERFMSASLASFYAYCRVRSQGWWYVSCQIWRKLALSPEFEFCEVLIGSNIGLISASLVNWLDWGFKMSLNNDHTNSLRMGSFQNCSLENTTREAKIRPLFLSNTSSSEAHVIRASTATSRVRSQGSQTRVYISLRSMLAGCVVLDRF